MLLIVKVWFVLCVHDVRKTEISDYVQVYAKKPVSVLFCWRLRALKSQTECCMIASCCQAAFCPLEPSSCGLPCEYMLLFLPSVQRITTECLPGGSGVFLCPECFYLGTCNQVLNCFLLYSAFPCIPSLKNVLFHIQLLELLCQCTVYKPYYKPQFF